VLKRRLSLASLPIGTSKTDSYAKVGGAGLITRNGAIAQTLPPCRDGNERAEKFREAQSPMILKLTVERLQLSSSSFSGGRRKGDARRLNSITAKLGIDGRFWVNGSRGSASRGGKPPRESRRYLRGGTTKE